MGVARFSPLAFVVAMVLAFRSTSMNCGTLMFHGSSVVQDPVSIQRVASTAVQRSRSWPVRSSAAEIDGRAAATANAAMAMRCLIESSSGSRGSLLSALHSKSRRAAPAETETGSNAAMGSL